MYIIIWEYQIIKEKRSEFEAIYSANGAWAQLFKKGLGYLGTELLHSDSSLESYATIDRWASQDAYETFLIQHEKEYKTLDAQCEGLTIRESLIGKWITI